MRNYPATLTFSLVLSALASAAVTWGVLNPPRFGSDLSNWVILGSLLAIAAGILFITGIYYLLQDIQGHFDAARTEARRQRDERAARDRAAREARQGQVD